MLVLRALVSGQLTKPSFHQPAAVSGTGKNVTARRCGSQHPIPQCKSSTTSHTICRGQRKKEEDLLSRENNRFGLPIQKAVAAKTPAAHHKAEFGTKKVWVWWSA